MSFVSDLDTPLLQLSTKDHFTLRDACDGVHIFGGIGSGKTSGSGKALAGAYLRAGMGGLVLCAKPEEVELWVDYCKQHGREQSMILFDKEKGCNFIAYEFARKGADAANSVTDTIMRLIEAADSASGQKGTKGEQFWINTAREMLLYSVTALYGAMGNVSARDVVHFISTMPTQRPNTPAELNALKDNFAFNILQKFKNQRVHDIEADLVEAVLRYWGSQYLAQPEKTRGSIVTNVTSSLNRFSTGMLRACFCDKTNIVPEMTFSGAIIILALPVLTYNTEGVIAQQLFKLLWQRAVESRNGLPSQFRDRPVFLYADEAQYFVNSYDDQFLSTCRGSKASVVYLTQSLPTYYAMLGKEYSDAVDGFVGKFNTKIFHLNADPRTNDYASSLIGRGIKRRLSGNETTGSSTQRGSNYGGSESDTCTIGDSENYGSQRGSSGSGLLPDNFNRGSSSGGGTNRSLGNQRGTNYGHNSSSGTNESVTSGFTDSIDNLVESNWFSTALRTGGPKGNFEVTALWFRAGAKFRRPMPEVSDNVLLATFRQDA